MEVELERELPAGFRFHPTDEELIEYYLSRVALGKKAVSDNIPTFDIYLADPWDLQGTDKSWEREWYFFVPKDRKARSGGRPNRTTASGLWKETGSERPIRSTADPKRVIGLKKTLVFHQGRARRGTKTDWIMNEYHLPDGAVKGHQVDMVLCKIYRKATPLKDLEQRASAIQEMKMQRTSNDGVDGGAARACTVSAGDDYLPATNHGVLDWLHHPSLTQLLETSVWNRNSSLAV